MGSSSSSSSSLLSSASSFFFFFISSSSSSSSSSSLRPCWHTSVWENCGGPLNCWHILKAGPAPSVDSKDAYLTPTTLDDSGHHFWHISLCKHCDWGVHSWQVFWAKGGWPRTWWQSIEVPDLLILHQGLGLFSPLGLDGLAGSFVAEVTSSDFFIG